MSQPDQQVSQAEEHVTKLLEQTMEEERRVERLGQKIHEAEKMVGHLYDV